MKGPTWEFPAAGPEAHGPAVMGQEAQNPSWGRLRKLLAPVEGRGAKAQAVLQMLVRG